MLLAAVVMVLLLVVVVMVKAAHTHRLDTKLSGTTSTIISPSLLLYLNLFSMT